MKNNHFINALLAALLCLSLIACGTADALNNSSITGPVIPIENAEPPAGSGGDPGADAGAGKPGRRGADIRGGGLV